MILKNDKDIKSIFYDNREVKKIYHGSNLIWESNNSCFSAGYWDNELGWNDDEGWVN